ncbi:MAG: acetyl-CoA acetyltransferase [Desulfobacterales bacterium]|jgi:acetyl-CoA C-acetyltransferase|nr:acetyl-CoA acetyltransferase [Desulfobacter sp.]MDP6394880.1 acetyl-CoA acetyltransferase [Desulfobacterales bacterium]MDP6682051.1 acetyl-CoA acetyltransferase [Desulfobacterales bacterium]MDP6807719.1 acetyl-CoA acetyltransferase [Desulfobacterales bacterium]|tara:strand:- start:33329 stop:34528 length:1200 start_codon:yes stop_codon:yes gene_type:complete
MATGIKDKVAILGMGCSKFGERYDCDPEDLMFEAFQECQQDAGIETEAIDAAWLGMLYSNESTGSSATPMSLALRLPNIPTTRVENMCCTGTEAFRGAAYAVASGACNIALALGVEKLKDTGYSGLPARSMGPKADLWWPGLSAPGAFAQLASAYRAKHNVPKTDLKEAMAHVSWKSHRNGVLNPKAHLRKDVSMEKILSAPMIADPLGLFDCCGVSDGCACAIVTTPEIARSLGKQDLITVKALQLSNSNGLEAGHRSWDGSYFVTTRAAVKRAYEEAGIKNPRHEISMFEAHDCFSITELVTMEDLFISPEGGAGKDILDGFYDHDGKIPCQIDGGLKCFGHPIGASGLRMIYEMYLQFQGRADKRQLKDPNLGMTHNLGGFPHQNVCGISIIGRGD